MESITITLNAQQAQRAAPAFGDLLNVAGGNANTAQVKAWLIEQLRGVVLTYEIKEAEKARVPPATFTPT